MMPAPHLSPPARRPVLALSLAVLGGPALAHPGHEHTVWNLFDLMHVGGALALVALCAAGIALARRRHAMRRASRHTPRHHE